MKHTNKIAIKVLSEQYEDYKYREENSWHYDRQYKMIVKALSEFEKLNKSDVSSSLLNCKNCNGYYGVNINHQCFKCLQPLF